MVALRAAPALGPLLAEARAFPGVVSSDNQLDVDTFVAAVAKRASAGFHRLEKPPAITPVDGLAAGTRSDELYDPLLSSKRYESETAI